MASGMMVVMYLVIALAAASFGGAASSVCWEGAMGPKSRPLSVVFLSAALLALCTAQLQSDGELMVSLENCDLVFARQQVRRR